MDIGQVDTRAIILFLKFGYGVSIDYFHSERRRYLLFVHSEQIEPGDCTCW